MTTKDIELELELQKKLLNEVHDIILNYVNLDEPNFYETAAFRLSKEVLSPRIKAIKENCNSKEYYLNNYLYPAIFNKPEESLITGKKLADLFNSKSLKPVSQQRNKNTWCILAIIVNYFGWKGYTEKLTIEQAIEKFPAIKNSNLKYNTGSIGETISIVNEGVQQLLDYNNKVSQMLSVVRGGLITTTEQLNKSENELGAKREQIESSFSDDEKNEKLKSIFNIVANKEVLEDGDKAIINSFYGIAGKEKWKWYQKVYIINGTIIGLFKGFDETKFSLLFNLLLENDNKVWQRALVGIVFAFTNNFNDRSKIAPILRKLEFISQHSQIIPGVDQIFETLVLAKNQMRNIGKSERCSGFDFDKFMPFNRDLPFVKTITESTTKNVDTSRFWKALELADSLSNSYRYCIALQYKKLETSQISELISILETEFQSNENILKYHEVGETLLAFIGIVNDLTELLEENIFGIDIQEVFRTLKSREYITFISRLFKREAIIGYYYEDQEEYKKAIASYSKAILEESFSYNSHFRLGYVYFKLGDYQSSIKKFQKVVEINPFDFISHFYLGLNYYK